MLTELDRKYWTPAVPVIDSITKSIDKKARVLEIGPGLQPFGRADVQVDSRPDTDHLDKGKLINMDFAVKKLPFADKSFDFVYCRHVLEDMFDPFSLCKEMSRVGKAGYIETPSPVVECCRGIDGSSPPYRGYHHHRWVIWSNGTELTFITKFSIIEYCRFDEKLLESSLRVGPKYWNTYFPWKGEINVNHIMHPVMPFDYPNILANAITASMKSTEEFWRQLTKKELVNAV